MSAWIVSSNHVRHLVDGMIRHEVIKEADAEKVGKTLTRANVKSIRARYGEYDRSAAEVKPFRWLGRPKEPISDLVLYKQARCYDYQTCEFEGYESSRAGLLVAKLIRKLEATGLDTKSPEYGDAPWGI